MNELIDQLFDRHTLLGFIAWASLQLHLVKIGRRQATLERVQAVLVNGHVAGVQAHRELATELPKAAEASR